MRFPRITATSSFLLSLVAVTVVSRAEKFGQSDLILLPSPRQIERLDGVHRLQPDRFIHVEAAPADPLMRSGPIIQEALATIGPRYALTTARGTDEARLGVVVRLDPQAAPHAQGYELAIAPERITITAHDAAGAYYGAMTLRQIARQAATRGELPCVRIADWPDFAHRGVMIDISRDRVATMDTLYSLVDLLADLKINEFQLYMQHTFAYRNHRDVWTHASPMTGEQILALDAYCRERFIDLVPNQSSFAHFHRWLALPRYRDLGELPDNPFMLSPVEPGAIALLAEMYAELLPHFSSRMVNVNCDETWDLGKGKSKKAVEERGAGRVYLDFLLKIHDICTSHGRTMQFWGDIIMQHPELIPELPKDSIALEWGYEANHPFAEHGRKFAAAGIPFYVCPGTSSWNSIAGRTENAIGNLRNASENGRANGAIGFLNTDWGDNGHWQHLPISYLGYSYGAAVSWNLEANKDIDLPRALSTHVFRDRAGAMGQLAYDLGNAYKETGAIFGNSTAFFHLLSGPQQPFEGEFANLTTASLTRAIEYIDRVMARLPDAKMDRPDAPLIADQFRNNADMLRHAARLALARRGAERDRIANIPPETRQALAADLERILAEYRRLWLAQSRPGGLQDSVARFEQLLGFYHRQ